jgi:hypothetical protein
MGRVGASTVQDEVGDFLHGTRAGGNSHSYIRPLPQVKILGLETH